MGNGGGRGRDVQRRRLADSADLDVLLTRARTQQAGLLSLGCPAAGGRWADVWTRAGLLLLLLRPAFDVVAGDLTVLSGPDQLCSTDAESLGQCPHRRERVDEGICCPCAGTLRLQPLTVVDAQI